MIQKVFRALLTLFAPPRLWYFLGGAGLGCVLAMLGLMSYAGLFGSASIVGLFATSLCEEVLLAQQNGQTRRLLAGCLLGFLVGILPYILTTTPMRNVDLFNAIFYAMLGAGFRNHRVSGFTWILVGALVVSSLVGAIAFAIPRDKSFNWPTLVGGLCWGAACGAWLGALFTKKRIPDGA